VRPEALARSHLMLGVAVDAVACPSLWQETVSAITDAACMASSGAISCRVDGNEAEHVFVVASGQLPASGAPPLRSAARRWADRRARTGAQADAVGFAFDACVILTCYALPAEDTEPSERTPSFVFGTVPRRGIAPLASDVAPYLMVTARDEWECALNRAIANAQDDVLLCEGLQEMLRWAQETEASWFGHQLEPTDLAGQGSAHRLGGEAARRAPPAQLWKQTDDELPLACDSPWLVDKHGRHVCPLCGSADTIVVAVQDRRAGVTEVRCHGCGHFDAWTA
jgi:hypothetical protein